MGAVRAELQLLNAESIVITALDEVAWLLNIRGSDLPFSPLVRSYVFLSLNRLVLFVDLNKVTNAIRDHLENHGCSSDVLCVE